jgi:hypothetical protein
MLRLPRPKTHFIHECGEYDPSESPAFPGETSLLEMHWWIQHASDHAKPASPDPEDARIRP